jgi:hypothetical protein
MKTPLFSRTGSPVWQNPKVKAALTKAKLWPTIMAAVFTVLPAEQMVDKTFTEVVRRRDAQTELRGKWGPAYFMYIKAVEALEQALKDLKNQYEHDSADLREAIGDLKQRMKKNNNGTSLAVPAVGSKMAALVQPGEWRKLSITEALIHYLANCDGPQKLPEVIAVLDRGGVKMGKRQVSNVKTTIGNNRKKFHYNRRSNTIQLRGR